MIITCPLCEQPMKQLADGSWQCFQDELMVQNRSLVDLTIIDAKERGEKN